MLGQRLRRWPNIKPVLGQRLVFAITGPQLGHGRLNRSDLVPTGAQCDGFYSPPLEVTQPRSF